MKKLNYINVKLNYQFFTNNPRKNLSKTLLKIVKLTRTLQASCNTNGL